jgi:outer membrane protein TolC
MFTSNARAFRRLAVVSLLFLVGVIVWSVSTSGANAGGPALPAREGAPKDKGTRLKALLTERLAVAREAATLAEKAFRAGGGSGTQVHEANLAVLNAELDLCERDKDRIPVLEKFVAAMKRFEEHVTEAHKSGTRSSGEVLKAKLARLEAEIALERAKAKAGDPTK